MVEGVAADLGERVGPALGWGAGFVGGAWCGVGVEGGGDGVEAFVRAEVAADPSSGTATIS